MSMSAPPVRFIDANMIMYSIGGPHPLREPCKKFLEKIKTQEILCVTNTEVLQEILYRYFLIERGLLGEIAYQSMIEFCTDIFPVRVADTDRALEILKRVKGITSRDAVHVATMIHNGIREIISTDPHFDLIPEIKIIDPTRLS
jgi:predicted nucleic acid-binding protein